MELDKYKLEAEQAQEDETNCLYCGEPCEETFCNDWCQGGYISENHNEKGAE